MKLHDSAAVFAEFLARTAEATGIHAVFVEKDYWLTTVLRALSESKHQEMTVFKGGTSLFKGFSMIERFSEDVDLALIVQGLSNNQVKSRMDTISKTITRHLPEVQVPGVTSKGSRFRRTAHVYPSLASQMLTPNQMSPELVLEINAFANPYPHQQVQLESLITTFLRNIDKEELIVEYEMEPFSLQVLRPERTLTEKVLALARASYHPQPVAQLQAKIRHTYDLHQLLQRPELQAFVASDAFFQTLQDVQADDAKNSEFQGEWAAQPLAGALIFQGDAALWKQLEATYTGPFKSLVYGQLPALTDIVQSLHVLAQRLQVYDQNVQGK